MWATPQAQKLLSDTLAAVADRRGGDRGQCETPEVVRRVLSSVIASAAKQSIAPQKERMDCFASLAMTLRDRPV